MSFQLSVITPQGKVYEDSVDSLAATGLAGGFEVYSNHAPFLTGLKEGFLKIRKNGKEDVYQTASGILEVKPDHHVLVLVDAALGAG